MGIEKKIKQKKFEDEYHKTLLNILFIADSFQNNLAKILKAHQLTIPQYNILRILKGSHPNSVSPSYIKQVIIYKGSDITRLIDRLAIKKLVKRNHSQQDRRKIQVLILSTGIELLEALSPQINELRKSYFEDKVTLKEAKLINTILDKI